MAIKLSNETTEALILSIKKYFKDQLDEEIGDLRAKMLLDFILIDVGPSVYNQAIRDAQSYLHEKALDLDGSCYEPEMTYWQSKPGRSKRG